MELLQGIVPCSIIHMAAFQNFAALNTLQKSALFIDLMVRATKQWEKAAEYLVMHNYSFILVTDIVRA